MINFNVLPNVVAIVGSRDWPEDKRNWIYRCVDKIKPRTLIVSGGARGVDQWVEEQARYRESVTKDAWFKPMYCTTGEWELFGRSAGHERNEDIVLFLKKHQGHMIIFALEEAIEAKKGGSFNNTEWCGIHNVPYTLIVT